MRVGSDACSNRATGSVALGQAAQTAFVAVEQALQWVVAQRSRGAVPLSPLPDTVAARDSPDKRGAVRRRAHARYRCAQGGVLPHRGGNPQDSAMFHLVVVQSPLPRTFRRVWWVQTRVVRR